MEDHLLHFVGKITRIAASQSPSAQRQAERALAALIAQEERRSMERRRLELRQLGRELANAKRALAPEDPVYRMLEHVHRLLRQQLARMGRKGSKGSNGGRSRSAVK
jgi:hypothetical protein